MFSSIFQNSIPNVVEGVVVVEGKEEERRVEDWGEIEKMPVARPESSDSRVIAHIDMDCFYVQVEQRKQPTLRGHPTAVVQYNSWKGGGLIAVGYEARKYGVKRSMRGDEAKKVCPDIQLVQVPVARGKADLTVYRDAGSEVVSILSRKGRCERASIDEVYLDLTEVAETMLAENPPERLETICEEAFKSHDGSSNQDSVKKWFYMSDADRRDKLLACGALIVAELRLEVLKETEYTCSAGIAHNKMLAKLASGMNKPAQQTIVPLSSVSTLLESLPIKKMKQLGGKLGNSLQADLCVDTVGDLLQFSEDKLQERYGINTGTWLWNIARGICGEEVEGRLLPKSHGSGKTFPGRQALKTISSVQKWIYELCEELSERLVRDLEQNKRIAHTLTLHASAHKLNDSESLKKFPSKSCPLRYGIAKIQEDALNLFHAGLREYIGIHHAKMKQHNEWAITGLSVSASKIVATPSGTHSITKYFGNKNQTSSSALESNDIHTQDAAYLSSSGIGSSVELHLSEPQIANYEDEASDKHDMPCFNPDGDETEVCKDSVFTTKFAEQDPTLFGMKEQSNGITEEISLSCSGSEKGLASKVTQSKMDFLGPVLKSEKQKRKFEKEKVTHSLFHYGLKIVICDISALSILSGSISCLIDIDHLMLAKYVHQLFCQGNSSILKYFASGNSCSFPEPRHVKTFQERGASSSGMSVQGNQQQPMSGTTLSTCNLGQDDLRSDTWRSYKSDEIDPSVLKELPPEIQAEVRASFQPQKRANIVKRGSSIDHYFSPTANS
ncbi:PREDICTED: DNA polymerase eta isoform X2 [Erythranthe guttata]|uniref:DNA polymerase eta isoform X2 n=1 Tax=Erythranthe guttata TaxID=4155 RepID=UPI00064DD179|nr:PREDICTED: DNA polymerase eta isoform X2 [Erythranthe guttata]|eukprot:XP_012829704.1 PREDICTED: DNA polymerase eta isoform X2 [Erythranthe guttata]